jgi:hypothetical protein
MQRLLAVGFMAASPELRQRPKKDDNNVIRIRATNKLNSEVIKGDGDFEDGLALRHDRALLFS